MSKSYIDIPDYIYINDIINKNYSLSPQQYKKVIIKNINCKVISDLLGHPPISGKEVGSDNYVDSSDYIFVRTKSIQGENFCIDLDITDSYAKITPKSYKANIGSNNERAYQKGDILFVTGGNVGEVAYVNQETRYNIISSHILRLIFKKNRYYIFAFLKSDILKEQVNIAPSGGIKGLDSFNNDYLLKSKIPFPKDDLVIKYVELLVQAIINKESEIKVKYRKVSDEIKEELENNQNSSKKFVYSLPTINELFENSRLDTKTYSKEFKEIEFMLTNYKNGYFRLRKNEIKGGNTPKNRVISEVDSLLYNWITPTIYSNIGLLTNANSINCSRYNIKKDCLLIVNRTSKGDDGQFVGMSFFYNYDYLGKGQHNQGIYRVDTYDKTKLIYINALLNSEYYRVYCGGLSMGSKMKEIKVNEVCRIPFPKFPNGKEREIVALYYNTNIIYDPSKCNLNNFLDYDNNFNYDAGIYELDKSMKLLKRRLNKVIEDIVNDKKVEIEFSDLKLKRT